MRRHDPTPDLTGRLDHYYGLIKTVLLCRQDPITGLLPASTAVNAHGNYTDAWVRDNVYSILAVWGLAVAYRKVDFDRGRTYELEQGVVKTMRGLLFAMMRQSEKVERFKQTQSPLDALHAKYDTRTGGTAVDDDKWGHLQIDATSLYLLMLGEMTASGLSIIFTIDEVNFVQNLIYYIGRAYRTPDYGIWERGNKVNKGYPELNASSIGMAKAALQALNGLNIFGVRGSQPSVLHVLPDEIARCRITLESLLPWESSSKEVDAALLSVVGYPAFAVADPDLVDHTRERVVDQLLGRYGCKRFLRDGHQTVLEDAERTYYEPWELRQFEHIECEWPLFFVYLMLDALFREDHELAASYRDRIEGVMIEQDGVRFLPELYFVPEDRIDAERRKPGSQDRVPNANVPLVWAQSLYYLAMMLCDGLLEPGEIDPLGRRLRLGQSREPVVQVALLAEDESLQAELETQGVATQTPRQLEPVQVRQAGELAAAYHQIGRNDTLGMTGRPIRRLRSLSTSKVFLIRGQLMVFLPSFLDTQKFHLMRDDRFLVARIESELAYVQRHWRQLGRPTVTLLLTRAILATGRDALLELIHQMKLGRCGDVDIRLGHIGELRQTAGLERIDYLHDFEFSSEPVRDAQPEQFALPVDHDVCDPLAEVEEIAIEGQTNTAAIAARLAASRNVYEQVALLQALARIEDLDYVPVAPLLSKEGPGVVPGGPEEGLTVRDLLEDVYAQAGQGAGGRPYWSVVRRAAGLLDKTDVALGDSVIDILVRQKQITVGKSYSDASLIERPISPEEIRQKIRTFAGADVRDWILTQEVLIYLGLMIISEPHLFRGLLTLRIGYLIVLITGEIADEQGLRLEDAHEALMHLSPSEIQSRLRSVLGDYDDKVRLARRRETLVTNVAHLNGTGRKTALPRSAGVPAGSVQAAAATSGRATEVPTPPGGWLRYRQKQGALNRVPDGFYRDVWTLLKQCKGLIIGEKLDVKNRLDSALILSEMTAGEKNFALWVERLLNKTDASKYRQLNIEALTALAAVTSRNPALVIDDYLVLDVVIGHAVRLAWLEEHPNEEAAYDDDRSSAWTAFYELSPATVAAYVGQALAYLTGAVRTS